MKIIDKWLTPNKYSRPQTKVKKVKGIVIHWIASPNGTAQGVYNYFEGRKHGNNSYGSAHETIDLNGDVWRMIPPNEMAYHVGSKTYTKEALNQLSNYPNDCTYGIECTHVDANGKMTDETYKSLTIRCAQLCKGWGLNPLTDLWLHKEVVGWKDCHKWFVDNPDEWKLFKQRVKDEMRHKEVNAMPELTENQKKVQEWVKEMGISDGKDPFKPVNQFYIWSVLYQYHKKLGDK